MQNTESNVPFGFSFNKPKTESNVPVGFSFNKPKTESNVPVGFSFNKPKTESNVPVGFSFNKPKTESNVPVGFSFNKPKTESNVPVGQNFNTPKSDESISSSEEDSDEEISKKRYVTVSEFRGEVMVNIREHYCDANGQLRPGKKGIAMTVEQWNRLKDLGKNIDEAISSLY